MAEQLVMNINVDELARANSIINNIRTYYNSKIVGQSQLGVSLLVSMIAGRIVWGVVRVILAGLSGSSFTWALFLAGAFTNAIPGIILQLVLIPILVIALERAGLSLNRPASLQPVSET